MKKALPIIALCGLVAIGVGGYLYDQQTDMGTLTVRRLQEALNTDDQNSISAKVSQLVEGDSNKIAEAIQSDDFKKDLNNLKEKAKEEGRTIQSERLPEKKKKKYKVTKNAIELETTDMNYIGQIFSKECKEKITKKTKSRVFDFSTAKIKLPVVDENKTVRNFSIPLSKSPMLIHGDSKTGKSTFIFATKRGDPIGMDIINIPLPSNKYKVTKVYWLETSLLQQNINN